MIDLISLASTALAFFIVAVTPGPANISNATIALSYGRKISLIYGAGLSCGLMFWGIIAASGMGALLQSSIYLLMTLKLFGGLYLLWLAFQSGRHAMASNVDISFAPTEKKWFIRGLILNISNPKSVLAWMAALSVGLDSGDGVKAITTATVVCIFVGFANNALYSILFSIKGMMRGYQKCHQWVSGVAATLFTLAGFGLIHSALSKSNQ